MKVQVKFFLPYTKSIPAKMQKSLLLGHFFNIIIKMWVYAAEDNENPSPTSLFLKDSELK